MRLSLLAFRQASKRVSPREGGIEGIHESSFEKKVRSSRRRTFQMQSDLSSAHPTRPDHSPLINQNISPLTMGAPAEQRQSKISVIARI